MVGLEHAASVLQEVIFGAGGSWELFSKVISRKPAEIAGLSNQGVLGVGSDANITLIDPNAKREISAKTHSKSTNNPFQGITLPGQIVHTIYKGKFTVRDSELESI
jgi:dihydroorotase